MGYTYKWSSAFEAAFAGKRTLLDEHIHQIYHSFLFPFVKAKTHSDDDCFEICSAVIAKFWEKFYVRQETLPNNVNAYLNTMARNATFHFFNLKTREKKTLSFIDESRLKRIVENDSNGNDPLELNAEHNEKEKLYQALEVAFDKLGERCRDLLRLNILENKRIRDIASLMGFPSPNAATQKKVSCFKKLKKLLYLEIYQQKS